MHPTTSGLCVRGSRLTALLGTVSMLTLAQAERSYAQPVVAQAEDIPETVLITGSLIRGTTAVGVPVINLSPQDFAMTGTLTASDLFRTIPQFNVNPGPVATQAANNERGTRVNLRQLDTGSAPRSLMMIDGMRYPQQGNGLCQIDPSIIPAFAIERIDLLLDGASATYGSDAIGGVINIILKRNFDGAMVEAGWKYGKGGNTQYLASGMWGRTWDGGQVTLSYSWFDIAPTHGNFHSKFTYDHRPWGFDDRRLIGSSTPGTISTGAPRGALVANPIYDPLNPQTGPEFVPNDALPGNLGTNCTNCYAIPKGTGFDWDDGPTGYGPLAPGSAPTLNWANLSAPGNAGTNGTRNVFNPYDITYYSAAVQYTGGVVTLDQRLTSNISFYGEGIWGMRRSSFVSNDNGHQISYPVPTFNPYYPTGAPSGLRSAYHMGIEKPQVERAYAMAQRYQLGLNIALPGDWAMQVYFSHTKDKEYFNETNDVIKASVSAALGWTIPVTPAGGTTPAIASWTKPSSVPYLNLFCDPLAYKCNSDDTLNYLHGITETSEYMHIKERGIKADGPLFDLPGGTVKMAVGANYTTYNFLITQIQTNQTNPTVTMTQDPRSRARLGGLCPVEHPDLQRPELASGAAAAGVRGLLASRPVRRRRRHQQREAGVQLESDRVANDPRRLGAVVPGAELRRILAGLQRGLAGMEFRQPTFLKMPSTINISCAGAAPPAGSGADKLFQAGLGCGTTQGGISLNGGGKVAVDTLMRKYTNFAEQELDPEKAVNWSIGFDYTPSGFLTGLNLQATYYIVKINGILRNFGNPTTGRFNDPSIGFVFLTPEDMKDPITGAQLCPGHERNARGVRPLPGSGRRRARPSGNRSPGEPPDIGLLDQRRRRHECRLAEDERASTGRPATIGSGRHLGAFNTGITGTYYLSQESQVPGGLIDDFYHTNLAPLNGVEQLGVESRPRFKYRARLGWSDGTWSVTGFMDYESHFFHIQGPPPNVNFACITPGGTVGGSPAYTNPCWVTDYTNIQPSFYTFDLSLGYDTGDRPANPYLRNVSVQLVVQNLMDQDSPYQYRISTGGGNPCACDIIKSLFGRVVSMRLQKKF